MRTQYGTYEARIDTRDPKSNRLTGWFFKSVYAGSTAEANAEIDKYVECSNRSGAGITVNRRAFDCYFVV